MIRIPGFVGNVLGQLIAKLGIQFDPLEIAYDDGDGGIFRDALFPGTAQIFRDADLGEVTEKDCSGQ